MNKTVASLMLVLLVGAGMTLIPGVEAHSTTADYDCHFAPWGTVTDKVVTKQADGCPWLEDGPIPELSKVHFYNDQSGPAGVIVYKVEIDRNTPLRVWGDHDRNNCLQANEEASDTFKGSTWKPSTGLYQIIMGDCPGLTGVYEDDVLVARKIVHVLVAPELPNPIPDPLITYEGMPWICQATAPLLEYTVCAGDPPWYPGNCAGIAVQSTSNGPWTFQTKCIDPGNTPRVCTGTYDPQTHEFREDCTRILQRSGPQFCVEQWHQEGQMVMQGAIAVSKGGQQVRTASVCVP